MADKIFLNYAATCPIRPETARYLQKLCSEMCTPLGAHFYSWLGTIEHTRGLLAELIGADPSELSFLSNTSSALSVLALALPWREGDVVLVASDEFSSNRFVWQNLSSKGVKCRFFQPTPAEPIVETLQKQDLTGVRLISVSAVSYCSGRLYELEQLCRFCSEHRILSCLDAIQAVGATAIDCRRLDLDFLVGGAQKWLLGPIGCGYLFVKRRWLEQLFVPLVGWTSAKYPERFELQNLDFCDEMARFEPGLPNFLPIAGLGYSLEQLKKQGWERIFKQIADRRERIEEGLLSLGYRLKSAPTDRRAGIVSTELAPELIPRKVQEHFERRGISVTVRDYLRVSPHFDTPYEQIDRFLDAASLLLHKPCVEMRRPQPTPPSRPSASRAWIIGATGSIGQALAYELAARGFHLDLVAGHESDLKALAQELLARSSAYSVTLHCCDLSNQNSVESLITNLQSPVDLMILAFAGCDPAPISYARSSYERAFLALSHISTLISGFERFKRDHAKGILSFHTPTAWVPMPGVGYHHAAHMALWQIMHTLKLEANYPVLLYPLASTHSKLQKRVGRVLLRYFKSSGHFDYAHPEWVAADAVTQILNGKQPRLPIKIKVQLLFALLLPQFWYQQIRKRLWN